MSRAFSATSSATGVLILALALPLPAQRTAPAQRGGPPRTETPQLVVATLSSSDRGVGAAAADAIRKRMQSEHNATDLYLTPGLMIERALTSSGYPTDSALGQSDLLMLAKQVRGDYALAGDVERTTSGMRTTIRLLIQRGQLVIAEPIAPVLGNDLADVAKKVDVAVSEALHALSFHRDCMNALVAGDYVRAMTAAKQGLAIRPTSAAINQCVLAVLRATNASPDSIIAVATTITSVDSSNVIAWANLADAYVQKNDAAGALAAARMVHRLDPANADVTSSLVDRLVAAGQPEAAVALIDSALTVTPGNPALLRKQWLILLRVGRFADAMESGKALVAADSSAANLDYFQRQVGTATRLRDSASLRRFAVDAAARFPKETSFLLVLAHDALDHGAAREALGFVDRALTIDAKDVTAWQLAIAAQAKANGVDSAVATGRRALTAGVTKDALGESLIAVVGPTVVAAQASQKRGDWEVVLRQAQAVDSVASTPRSNFYVGVAAYQIASDDMQGLSAYATKRAPTRAERQAACESSTRTEGLLSTVTIALPKGGSVDPGIAGKILGAISSMTDFVSSVKQASCRVRPDE